MGEDTDGLRRDIQDTRGELTRDVDALTEKVSPVAFSTAACSAPRAGCRT